MRRGGQVRPGVFFLRDTAKGFSLGLLTSFGECVPPGKHRYCLAWVRETMTTVRSWYMPHQPDVNIPKGD